MKVDSKPQPILLDAEAVRGNVQDAGAGKKPQDTNHSPRPQKPFRYSLRFTRQCTAPYSCSHSSSLSSKVVAPRPSPFSAQGDGSDELEVLGVYFQPKNMQVLLAVRRGAQSHPHDDRTHDTWQLE